jgi:hypothetical protein
MNISDITNLEEELASKAEAVHTHPTSDIDGLVEALSNKASVDHTHDISDFPDFSQAVGNFAPAVHGHTISQITDLTAQLASKASATHFHTSNDITDLNSVLATRAPVSHSHEISAINGLQNALNAKSNLGGSVSISNVTDLQTTLDAKSNVGHFHDVAQITGLTDLLEANGRVTPDWGETNSADPSFIANKPTFGSAAFLNVGTTANDVAAGSHVHSATEITSGILPLSVIPVIPGTQTIVSSGGISAITAQQQELIISGSNVVTSDGRRFVYAGSGDKNLETSYILVSSTDVDYSEITNTPTNATTTVAGLMSATDKVKLDGVANNANNYIHPAGDANLHVPATGTGNDGRVLTAGATAGAISWRAIPTPTRVSNLSGGQPGRLAYQSAIDTTAFLSNGSSGDLLRSNGAGQPPNWLTPGNIITKNQSEYVATDAVTGGTGSITKITRITAANYAVATKDPATLYVVVG